MGVLCCAMCVQMALRIPTGANRRPLEEYAKKGLEIVPIEHAELHKLDPELLHPGRLPELWQSDSGPITAGEIRGFFDGVDAPKLASDSVLFEAIQDHCSGGFTDGISPRPCLLQ